jgi:predicted methyltransferase
MDSHSMTSNSLQKKQNDLFRLLGSTKKEIVVCPTCEGTKIQIAEIFKGHSRGWENEPYTCTQCNGEGMLTKITTIKFQPYENSTMFPGE